ncbi:serine--tRNA ligase [Candidatus Dependentiae bacterium]|nr:MAG: serine--tRNA ligase [Candidatus Dependentiae bacterium]
MIDLHLLRDDPKRVKALLLKKDPSFPISELIELDKRVREIQLEVEDIRKEKNELAQQAKKGVTREIRSRSIALSKQLHEKEVALNESKEKFNHLYLLCPNILAVSVPAGGREQNSVIKSVGKRPSFSFPIKNHLELGENLGWFDFETAVKITGSQFVFYREEAVKLLYALALFMLKHNKEHGYEMILPPYLVNAESLIVTGNFPKFKDQVYKIVDEDLYLTPTAEVELTNVYRDHIFEQDKLPRRMTSWTSCFRREAGGYGAAERGLVRMHQFEKVELYTVCEPDKSEQEQERMLECAQGLLKKLEIPYRIVLLAAQECSFPSAKTYDIEIWLPGQNDYYEISSISNCTDFQARRGAIRYKKVGEKRTTFVHTLNGSSLALPRLMAALMEMYQQPDGSIAIPDFLKHEFLF